MTPVPSRLVRAVVLDVDGTLVDSNDAHVAAWIEALEDHAVPVPEMLVRPLIGMGGDRLLLSLAGMTPEEETGRSILRRHGEIFREQHLPHLKPFPKAPELLKRLRARGLHLAVASSARRAELDALLDATGIGTLLDVHASADDVERSKPDPAVVHVALERLDVPAAEALMVGDTPYDVEAARLAGVRAVALRCGGWDERALAGAALILDDAADLYDHLDRPPLSGWLIDDQRGA